MVEKERMTMITDPELGKSRNICISSKNWPSLSLFRFIEKS
jgi:hypothetical protein